MVEKGFVCRVGFFQCLEGKIYQEGCRKGQELKYVLVLMDHSS